MPFGRCGVPPLQYQWQHCAVGSAAFPCLKVCLTAAQDSRWENTDFRTGLQTRWSQPWLLIPTYNINISWTALSRSKKLKGKVIIWKMDHFSVWPLFSFNGLFHYHSLKLTWKNYRRNKSQTKMSCEKYKTAAWSVLPLQECQRMTLLDNTSRISHWTLRSKRRVPSVIVKQHIFGSELDLSLTGRYGPRPVNHNMHTYFSEWILGCSVPLPM